MSGSLFAGAVWLLSADHSKPSMTVPNRYLPPPNPAVDQAQAARSVFGMLTLASVLTGFHGPSASAEPSRGVWLYLASLLQAPSYKARLEMLRS